MHCMQVEVLLLCICEVQMEQLGLLRQQIQAMLGLHNSLQEHETHQVTGHYLKIEQIKYLFQLIQAIRQTGVQRLNVAIQEET